MSGNIESAKVVQVIKTVETIGTGSKDDPARSVTKYWLLNGELIICIDPKKDYF